MPGERGEFIQKGGVGKETVYLTWGCLHCAYHDNAYDYLFKFNNTSTCVITVTSFHSQNQVNNASLMSFM